jgi:hypothetical protein
MENLETWSMCKGVKVSLIHRRRICKCVTHYVQDALALSNEKRQKGLGRNCSVITWEAAAKLALPGDPHKETKRQSVSKH